MPLAPDDHMIVDHHAEQPAGLGDALGDLDVGAARLGRAAGVIVNQDQRARSQVERLADHLARMDRGLVDAAVADVVIENQVVLDIAVELGFYFLGYP